jgi:hypothetical protein
MRNALGSLNETRDRLGAGLELRYLSVQEYDDLRMLADRAIGASVNLVKYLDSCKHTRRSQSEREEGTHDGPVREPGTPNLGTWNYGT